MSGHLPGSESPPRRRFGLRAVARTHPGLQRTVNEDALFCDERLGVFLVCDGMGGHASGQVASELAVQTTISALRGDLGTAPTGEPMVAALLAANQAVLQRSLSDPACHGMGTTAVALRADGDSMHVCHCGDSRAYLLRAGQLAQLTRDHSLVNLYADKPELAGQMGPAASNVIVRAIGLDERVEIDHQVVSIAEGDVYLLCCDGLSDLVPDGMIRDIMTTGPTLEAVGDGLVHAANANGGSDNITVILVGVFADAAATDPDNFPYTRPGF